MGRVMQAHSHLEVLDTLSIFLKLHRTTVIDENNDVEQRNLDEIRGELEGEFPVRREGLQRPSLDDPLSDSLEGLRRRIERLQVLLSSVSPAANENKTTHILNTVLQ
jgi:hypothetical protein